MFDRYGAAGPPINFNKRSASVTFGGRGPAHYRLNINGARTVLLRVLPATYVCRRN